MSNPYQPQQPGQPGPQPPRQGPPPQGPPPVGPAGPAPKPKSRLIPALIVGAGCAVVFGSCGVAVGAVGDAVPVAGPTVTVTTKETVTEPGAPGATVTATAAPGPTMTVTQAPAPASTVTVTEKPKPAPTVTKTVTKTVAPAAASGFGAGTYEVGVDMPAGKYKTKGPDDSGIDTCYWSRNEDASGENIIANALLQGQGVVEINKGEYFETTGCQDWVKQ